jgi:hypothetical protein
MARERHSRVGGATFAPAALIAAGAGRFASLATSVGVGEREIEILHAASRGRQRAAEQCEQW